MRRWVWYTTIYEWNKWYPYPQQLGLANIDLFPIEWVVGTNQIWFGILIFRLTDKKMVQLRLTWHKDASMLTKPTTMPKYWTNNNLIYIRYTVNLKNHWITDNDLPPLSVPLLLLSSTMDFDMATGFLLMFCDDDNGQCHPQFPSDLVHDFPSSFHLTHYALCVMIWRLIQFYYCTTSYPPHPSWFSVSDQKSTRG